MHQALTRFRDTGRQRRESGLTIAEMMVALLILGIIVAIAVPIFNAQRKVAADKQLNQQMIEAAKNIEQSRVAFGGNFPSVLPRSVKTNADTKLTYTVPATAN